MSPTLDGRSYMHTADLLGLLASDLGLQRGRYLMMIIIIILRPDSRMTLRTCDPYQMSVDLHQMLVYHRREMRTNRMM